MSLRFCLVLLMSLGFSQSVQAAVYYADNTLLSNCTSGNYSIANRACNGTDGDAYNTPAGVIAPIVAGDEIVVRDGIWTQQWDFQLGNKSGAPGAYITVRGYPGERPIFRYNGTATYSYGAIKVRGNRGYFIFKNFVYDGIDQGYASGWQIRDGNHHFILEDFELKNVASTGLMGINSSNITFRNCSVHDLREDLTAQRSRRYGFYPGTTDSWTIENCDIYNNPGGGIATNATAGTTNLIIRNNRIHHNGWMDNTAIGGITLYEVTGGNLDGAQIYNNIVYKNSLDNPTVGGGHGIVVGQGTSNARVWNNTVYGNKGYGINMQSGSSGPPTNTSVLNNIVTANIEGQIINAGTGSVIQYNACLSGDACGTTGKVTLSSSTEPFANALGDDYRLKQGTNPARNAGTATAARPSPVGAPDIGAYEQGVITSAAVVGDRIEATVSVMTPGVLPTTAISGLTATCVGCTGSPVVSLANIKSVSNNVIQLALSGISTPGTCTIAMGTTNATDSGFVGGLTGTAQGLNAVSSMSVTGTCVNAADIPNPSGLWSHFKLDEGSGTLANDDSGLAHHGTVSAGVAWVNDASGTGVTIPTDATYRQVSSTYGSGINPTTQGFGVCDYVKPTLTGNPQKVVNSSGTNGSNQRAYDGWATVGGQVQWGLGAQGSGFLTGSEFVVTENKTLVCMVGDPATDTLTLWVDGVKGLQAGKSVKSVTSYTLTGNFITGNDGTNTSNNGGYTLYEKWVWNTTPSDADITTLYASLTPTGSTACLAQSHVQLQHIYTTANLAPVVLTPKPDGSLDVIVNGGVAALVQYTCTGSAGSNVAPRLYYSTNGADFDLPVPQTLGLNNIAAWGASTDPYFNGAVVGACVDATGLTSNPGVTIADGVAGQTFTLAQNHCRADRYMIRVGNVPGTSFWFRVKTDAGEALANGYPQPIKINVIAPQAVMGF